MNFSSLIGVISGVVVMYLALTQTSDNIGYFFDLHGILIVIGGTAAAASISFPIGEVASLLKVFVLRVLGHNRADYQGVIAQLMELSKRAVAGGNALNEAIPSIKHPFLKEAVTLVATGVLSAPEIRAALEQRLKTVEMRYMHEANMFRSIGRYPPAFGLLATTLGMIALLQKIGQPNSEKLIGPAMSIGLIGTLYGIALANMVFLPIADNLTKKTEEEVTLRRVIIEGVMLLKTQTNPITLRETLNSFLLPRERVTRKAA
jgi:chemotaxis protein MotA